MDIYKLFINGSVYIYIKTRNTEQCCVLPNNNSDDFIPKILSDNSLRNVLGILTLKDIALCVMQYVQCRSTALSSFRRTMKEKLDSTTFQYPSSPCMTVHCSLNSQRPLNLPKTKCCPKNIFNQMLHEIRSIAMLPDYTLLQSAPHSNRVVDQTISLRGRTLHLSSLKAAKTSFSTFLSTTRSV